MTSTISDDLLEVWVAERGHAYAIGKRTALVYDGFAWSHVAALEALLADTDELASIWGVAEPLEIFVAGTRLFHYVNGAWSVEDVELAYPLGAVHGASRTSVLAAGLGEAWQYDGSTWTLRDPGIFEGFSSIWFAAPDDAYLTTSGGAIRRFTGQSWTTAHAGGASQDPLAAIWGSNSTDIYAGGISQNELPMLHYTASWMPIGAAQGIATSEVTGIWGTANSDVFVTTVEGRIYHFDGVAWTLLADTGVQLRSIEGNSPTDVFTVGAAGTILHYSGR